MRSSRWVAVTAAISLIAACGGDDDPEADAGEPDVVATTSATPTATVDETPTAPTTAPATPATAEPAVFAADAAALTSRFSPVEPGTYRVDTLGTPFTFTVDEPMFVQPNGQAFFVLTHPGSNGPDDRDLVFLRLSALSDPTDPSTPQDELGAGWPAADIAGWIENLTDAIVVTNRTETLLGGLPATSFDVALGEHDCPVGGFCALFGTNNGRHAKDLLPGSQYRVWVVGQGDEDPVAVIVGVNREDDIGFFDTAEAVLSTLAFGEVGPNPVFEAPAGPIEVPFLGGVRVELAEAAIVIVEPSGVGSIAPPGVPGDTEFLFNPTTTDGGAIESSDALIAVFEDRNVTVTEIEPTTIDEFDARVFDIGASGGPPLLLRSPDSGQNWGAPPRGRVWLVEHPERGLLMVTAEAFTDVDEVFPVILAQTEPIIESMEFIDPG